MVLDLVVEKRKQLAQQ